MKVISDAGIHYVEASADNECDPLYMDESYLSSWAADIRKLAPIYDIKIANLYSGHGTYSTLGLAHPDRRNADKMLFGWLCRMLNTAWELECGLGFFCHAFDQTTLQSPELYHQALNDLTERLSILAVRAAKLEIPKIGVEQMYTPHQIPWTINGARELLREIKHRSGNNFYLTIDTGHQSGQHKFRRPEREMLEKAIAEFKRTGRFDGTWLGPQKIYDLIRASKPLNELETAIETCPYLFADEHDSDTYEWLRQLAPYSPVIHLQQTDGKKSAHLPFNDACNATGIISGEKVINAIAEAYEKTPEANMPDRCEAIYLTLEIFGGTADLPIDIEYKVKDSAAYWRRFIPEDGLTIDKLREKL
ncbi:MAG: TIM barrel protein [Victivallaceae bacterium]|nr:TIM barrel protein [Victivallaceae bacterium]